MDCIILAAAHDFLTAKHGIELFVIFQASDKVIVIFTFLQKILFVKSFLARSLIIVRQRICNNLQKHLRHLLEEVSISMSIFLFHKISLKLNHLYFAALIHVCGKIRPIELLELLGNPPCRGMLFRSLT